MNLDRIKAIYEELERYVVQLHPDPRTLGPSYLTDLIATTRNYLNAVSRVQLEVHQEKQNLSRSIRAQEAAYQVSASDLLANDERVRRLPSIEDRKATVAVFLRSENQALEALKASLQDIEFVDKAVRHRHKELTATMSEIKLQRSLIRDEIDTGAMYGDERHKGTSSSKFQHPVFSDEFSEAELDRLMEENNGVGSTAELVQAVATPPAPPVEVTPTVPVPVAEAPAPVLTMQAPADPASEDAAIDAFLGDMEDEFSEVFSDL